MKTIAFVLLATAAACSKKDAAPPPPEPKPVAPAPTPAAAPPAAAPTPASDCVVKVTVDEDKVTFDGGGVTGESPVTGGGEPDLAKLEPLSGKCAANVTGTSDATYRAVITVSDALYARGFKDQWIGDRAKPSVAAPSGAPAPVGIVDKETAAKLGEERRQRLAAAVDAAGAKGGARVPTIVLSKTDAVVNDKPVGKVEDAALSTKIAGALAAGPSDPLIVVEADPTTTFDVVKAAIDAADRGGYTNIVFRVAGDLGVRGAGSPPATK